MRVIQSPFIILQLTRLPAVSTMVWLVVSNSFVFVVGVPILIPPDQQSGGDSFFENVGTVVLILVSLLLPTFVIVGLFWRKSKCSGFQVG